MSYKSTGNVQLVARQGYNGVGGVWDTVKDIGSGAAKGALDFYGSAQQAKGREQAYKEQLAAQQAKGGGMPSWLLPAAIGGGVLLLVILKKK